MGMTDTRTRQPRGIPVGGQYAAAAHSEAPLALAAAPSPGPEEQWLAAGGLKATLRKTARGHSYTSPGGRRVLLYGLGTSQATVHLGKIIVASGQHGPAPEVDVAAIRRLAWNAAVADAAKGVFEGGQYRPAAREPWISLEDGKLVACQPISGDYNSHFTYLRHSYSTGQTEVLRDVKVTRMQDDSPSVDDIVLRMRDGKDGAATAKEAFDLILSRVCADPDASKEILAHLHIDPGASAAAARFPQYRLHADIYDLDAEATKADHRLAFDPDSGVLQVRTGTATYSARVEIGADGSINRFLNDSYVQDFPVGYRKADGLEGWIRRRAPRLLEAAETVKPFDPLAAAGEAAAAHNQV